MTKTLSILPRLRALGQALACFALLLAADRPARADAIIDLSGDVTLTEFSTALTDSNGQLIKSVGPTALIFKEYTNHAIPTFSELDPAYVEDVLGIAPEPGWFIGRDFMETRILGPGSYPPDPLTLGSGPPSGTFVSTYIVHWFPVSGVVTGSVTFDSDVLAVQTTFSDTPFRERLFDRSDLYFYPRVGGPGISFGGLELFGDCGETRCDDEIVLSSDRRTISFTLRSLGGDDDFRVYVAPVPEPSSTILVVGGLLGMLVTRRRWRP